MTENKSYQQHNEVISLDDLKKFLWEAATHLRGQIDAAGYKEYIFPMLFFKRISDVYDEQFAGYLQDGGQEYAKMQAAELAIQIPDGAHWNDVRKVTENVGQALVQAFIDIEQANPASKVGGRMVGGLEGIFGPKDGWTNKNKMPDHVITSLIEDFSRYNLSLAHCPADEMGQAYEYLIGKFADDAGNTAQEFYTNRTVVELMAEILQPQPDESIYDPTCGSGGMLVKCLDYLRNKGEEWQGVHVYGQEINGLTSSIARMNLYLNGVEDFSIACADTLSAPAFTEGGKLQTFDVVLANPPYSIKEWDRTSFEHDKWGRNFLGTPPQRFADYAFIQHIIKSMDEKHGKCAILLPHGILFRDEEQEMRRKLVDTDKVECIIGLGPNLFYNSPMEACILICNNHKRDELYNKILFINAIDEVTRKNGESFLEERHIKVIKDSYFNLLNIDKFSRIVSYEEIKGHNFDLSIQKYIFRNEVSSDDIKSFDEEYKDWDISQQRLNQNLKSFVSLLS
jgi:type I restriction enzyme M protein